MNPDSKENSLSACPVCAVRVNFPPEISISHFSAGLPSIERMEFSPDCSRSLTACLADRRKDSAFLSSATQTTLLYACNIRGANSPSKASPTADSSRNSRLACPFGCTAISQGLFQFFRANPRNRPQSCQPHSFQCRKACSQAAAPAPPLLPLLQSVLRTP